MGQPNTRQAGAGTPDPLDFRYHRPVAPAGKILGAGYDYTVAVPVSVVIPIAGCQTVRLRGKFTQDGTLAFAYLRPRSVRVNDDDVYALSSPHADKAVVDATEFLVDIVPAGESELKVTFTPGASGEVTYFDVMNQ